MPVVADPATWRKSVRKLARVEAAGRDPGAIRRMIEIKVSYDRDRERAFSNTHWWAALALTPEELAALRRKVHIPIAADESVRRAGDPLRVARLEAEKAITMKEVEEAIDRVMAGPERKTRVMSEREKRVIAYHEGGHALVAHALPNLDPVHKVTILPRGRSLGHTLVLPTEDKYTQTRSEMIDTLAYALGGRAAEELPVAASAFRLVASEAYDHAARTQISVHGGIGATWEHDAPLYFRRAQLAQPVRIDAAALLAWMFD
jgi:hypothetical protein